MPFTSYAQPLRAKKAGTGISFSLTGGRKPKEGAVKSGGGRLTVRIFLRKDVQEQLFGGLVHGKKFNVGIGRGTDEGKLLIVQREDGVLVAGKSMHETAVLRMEPWDLLPKESRPSVAVDIDTVTAAGGVILTLPTWASPSAQGGRLAQEFALQVKPAR